MKKHYQVEIRNAAYVHGGYTAQCATLREAKELEKKERAAGATATEIIEVVPAADMMAWNENL